MTRTRAQITTRSGPLGTKNAETVAHGDWALNGRTAPREFISTLQELLGAARAVAGYEMVTEITVLIYPDPASVKGWH